MSRASKPAALERALQRWIEAILSREPARLSSEFSAGLHAVQVLRADEEDHVLDIGHHLPDHAPFRGPGDLVQFLYDELASILKSLPPADIEPHRIVTDLIHRLENPLRRFDFTAPLALRGAASLSGLIGGPNQLNFESIEHESGVKTLLSGTVEAPTEPMAIIAVEEVVEATLGLCLALDLCLMLTPLPGSSATLFLNISPHDDRIPSRLGGLVSAAISGAVLRDPSRPGDAGGTDPNLAQAELDGAAAALAHVLGSTAPRALELRRVGAFLLRASVSADTGLALTYGFMCLEGTLLERTTTDNVQSRLVEAVAYRIGRSAADRARIRREVKELYDIRSRYVHTGDPGRLAWTSPRERCLEIVSNVLRREVAETLE